MLGRLMVSLVEQSEHAESARDPLVSEVLAWREKADEDSARKIVEMLSPAIRSVAARMLPRAWMVEDVVQGTLANTFRSIERFDGRVPLRAWVVRLARNLCVDMLRGARRSVVIGLTDAGIESLLESGAADRSADLADTIMAREDLGRVLGQINAMNGMDREIARLVLLEGCPIEEAAAATRLTMGALRSRIFRIRRVLRVSL